MRLTILSLLIIGALSLYQVQFVNVSPHGRELTHVSSWTIGFWEQLLPHTIPAQQTVRIASSGSRSRFVYKSGSNYVTVHFGADGGSCDDCRCTVRTISSNSWRMEANC
ncbi:hypothetical protein GEMRC1_008697 [Eukaryota sp. GEM-RC1]